jgi:hypothetical protein
MVFDPRSSETFQYLGFNISTDGAVIRPGHWQDSGERRDAASHAQRKSELLR